MNKEKILSVAAIESGTVIDHITIGQGTKIVRLLKLAKHQMQVTLGLNLFSRSMGRKDLIKVEERIVTPDEANQIAIFAPNTTINIIENFRVVEKFVVTIPKSVHRILRCPNPSCITNHEKTPTLFTIRHFGERVELVCNYCEKSFSHESCTTF
ncbi:MAG: Aspartate carbamoyltransferase regulatory chain [Chlamydiae bacterium]|nr:Aspartate carbamoyltransferase regulatory chain [Chlamydiota bacterium]